jgi:uncharacterized protein (TIGR02118 family)
MIKRVSLVRRLPGLSHEEFVAHWSGPHVDLVRQLPGVRGLRLGVVKDWRPDGTGWDGVGEVWFDSRAAADAAFLAEPLATELGRDRALFLGDAQVGFVEEITIVPPPDGR